MSRSLLSAAIVLLAAASSHAQQVQVSYTRNTRHSSFTVVATLGGYYGYGGYGYGSAYGTPYGSSADSPYVYSPSRYSYAPIEGFGYDSCYAWRYSGRVVVIRPTIPPATPPDADAAEKIARAATDSTLEEGRRKWRSGDLGGALDTFKSAVGSDLKSGVAQIHMAMALLAAGDGRNADKAVRSGVELMTDLGPVAKIALRECFKDSKELAKFTARCDKSTETNGALAAALARLLLGDKAKAATQFGALKENAASRLAVLAK